MTTGNGYNPNERVYYESQDGNVEETTMSKIPAPAPRTSAPRAGSR